MTLHPRRARMVPPGATVMPMRKTQFSRGVGNRLKFARDEAGMRTAGQLADRMGLAELTVRRHLRGDTLPDVETLMRYAAVLGVTTDDLLPRLDSNQQPAGEGIAA